MQLPKLTIGIEEEYQLIDPETRELKSYVQEFLEEGRLVLQDQLKPEFLRSQIEVGSKICHDLSEAREELIRLRQSVIDLAAAHGLAVAAASSHPFSRWSDQEVTLSDRYTRHIEQLAYVAQRMLIFGMHVHVGIDDKEVLIDVMDQARYFIPHMLALSSSSPFWHGTNTGLKSYRSIVFENVPRSGPPPDFKSWAEYERFVDILIKTKCIDEATRIWWDIRPHPHFPTLEFRTTDICTTVDEAICLAALTKSIVAKLIKLRHKNQSWRRYRHHLIKENKWRAARYGINGKLLDFGRQCEVPMRQLTEELLEFIDDIVDEVEARKETEFVRTILEKGTSADRQVARYNETGRLEDVVDQLIEETKSW